LHINNITENIYTTSNLR